MTPTEEGQLIQHSRQGKYGVARLHVPADIARLVSPEARFRAELTEEGILFRYVSGQARTRLPKWVTNGR